MIFLANIGNTNVNYGLYEKRILASGYFPIHLLSCERRALALFRSLLRKCRVSREEVEGTVISSVVPEKNAIILNAAEKISQTEPVLISSQTGWEFDTSAYSGVLGTDRLLCCSAALQKYKPPFVVVDFGTATTLNVIDSSGTFAGGVILPGVRTGLRALAASTSQLHEIPFFGPKSAIGKNTAECMLSGATFGTAAMLEGLVRRIEKELGANADVIVTGGNAKAIIPYCELEARYEPELLLEGLAIQANRLIAVSKKARVE
ncbi:type III pantothenate kinase [Caproiciproducens galactitolivorans]|uniref:type III pantothenate kinase n=1 Tax=Caproiciproducens galactitolivorans TaxID=642589 RepID=UPI002409C856|nr:type III pantothenate kinase [Caproiciproducens galactitolivorans]